MKPLPPRSVQHDLFERATDCRRRARSCKELAVDLAAKYGTDIGWLLRMAKREEVAAARFEKQAEELAVSDGSDYLEELPFS
jgi:hypothetical protein